MDQQRIDADTQRAWRPKDSARELFGGRLVNRKRLCAPDMLNCSPAAVGKYVRKGMPSIKVGQQLLFDPDACRDWFLAQQRRAIHLVKGG
jgi:hypothetical protein